VEMSQKLSDALATVSLKDEYIEKLLQKFDHCEQNIQSAHEEVQLYKEKVNTFEAFVKSMEIGKLQNQIVRQENVKLAIKLKDSENEIRVLQEKLKEAELKNNDLKFNECRICLSHDMSKLQDSENEFRVLGKMNRVNKYTSTELPVKDSKNKRQSGGEWKSDETLKYSGSELEMNHEEGCKLISPVNVVPAVIEYSSNESEQDDTSIDYGISDNGSTEYENTSVNNSSSTGDDDSCSSYFDQASLDTRYVDEGIEYMSVAEDTMMRQYIFLQENCDESWFPTSEVVEEILRFVKQQSTGREHKCAKRRAKLKDILDELEVAVKNKKVKSEFLNDVFSRFYETEEGLI